MRGLTRLSGLGGMKPISPYHFAVFRILLGVYLAVHFAALLPYAGELFGAMGTLPDPRLNPTFGLFPNPLYLWDSAAAVQAFLAALIVLSICFALGIFRRAAAIGLWFGWACLFHRNNLINNPALPYVGLLLLLSALVPLGEGLSIRALRRRDPEERGWWYFPAAVYWVAWILMMAGYTYSGWIKLSSPSWIDGSALSHLLHNPLARPGPFRWLLLVLPPFVLKVGTWFALAAELLALPLSFHRRGRALMWGVLLFMQVGILTVVDFADLTAGMLLLHLFTFDPDWFRPRQSKQGRHLVLYDGVCGLCDRAVQFLLAEDRGKILTFAPLQGRTAKAAIDRLGLETDGETMVLIEDEGTANEASYERSAAALQILHLIGGWWRPAYLLRLVPRALRDEIYRFVAANRYQWFGRFDACKIPGPEIRSRFLE